MFRPFRETVLVEVVFPRAFAIVDVLLVVVPRGFVLIAPLFRDELTTVRFTALGLTVFAMFALFTAEVIPTGGQ